MMDPYDRIADLLDEIDCLRSKLEDALDAVSALKEDIQDALQTTDDTFTPTTGRSQ